MLSHALGTTKIQCTEEGSIVPPVKRVADYLNEKVHDLATRLLEGCEQVPVDANSFDLEAFAGRVDPDLWKTVTRLTQSSNDKLGRKQSDSHVQ